MAKQSQALTTPKVKEQKANESSSFKATMKFVELALIGAKAVAQALERLEPAIHEAEYSCLTHARVFGDIRPADRLIKGLDEIPRLKQFQGEILAWFVKNSNIRWDKDGNCRLLKPGDQGHKEFTTEDMAEAESEPFYKTSSAKRARNMAAAAHKRGLEPVTFENFANRVAGLRRWFKGAQEPNKEGVTVGVRATDKRKIEDGLLIIESNFQAFKDGKLKPVDNQEPEAVKAAKAKAKKKPTAEGEEAGRAAA